MPNQYNIYIYSFVAFVISLALLLYDLLPGEQAPLRREFLYMTTILTFASTVITYYTRPTQLQKAKGKAWQLGILILEKLDADGHFNNNHGEARIIELVRKADSRGLREDDIDELHDLVPACLLPPRYNEGPDLDWHRFDLCIVAARRDMELARRVMKELRRHYPQLRIFVDNEQVIAPQEELLNRIYYGGSRLCLALISGHLIHDARRKVALHSARRRVKDMLKCPRISGSEKVAYLKPVPLDEQGRLFMEKLKDLAPFAKHFQLIEDSNDLSRMIVNSILIELRKFPHLMPANLTDSDRNLELRHKVFISHSHKDKVFAHRLYDDLRARGVDCWYAPEDLTIGSWIRQTIEDAVRLHRKLLLILSENSIESYWVQNEVELAFEIEKELDSGKAILFPIKIDNAIDDTTAAWARTLRRERHIGDFTGWENTETYERALERLVLALQSE